MSERSKEMSSRGRKAFDKKSVTGAVVNGLSSVSITENTSAQETGTQWVFAWGVWKEIEQELYSKSHTLRTVLYAIYGLVDFKSYYTG